MPKLSAKDRKKVDKATAVSGEFEPLKPGKYVATLSGVETKKSNAGNPMWVAEFEEIHSLDGEKQPGRQWYNLNLPTTDTPPDDYEKTAEKWEQYQRLCEGRLKAFFEAFGYEVDSDTDEFVGERCVLVVGVRTIQSGPRAGEATNSVNGVKPLDSVEFEDDGDGGSSEDEF
jgi:hypothetical protein